MVEKEQNQENLTEDSFLVDLVDTGSVSRTAVREGGRPNISLRTLWIEIRVDLLQSLFLTHSGQYPSLCVICI